MLCEDLGVPPPPHYPGSRIPAVGPPPPHYPGSRAAIVAPAAETSRQPRRHGGTGTGTGAPAAPAPAPVAAS